MAFNGRKVGQTLPVSGPGPNQHTRPQSGPGCACVYAMHFLVMHLLLLLLSHWHCHCHTPTKRRGEREGGAWHGLSNLKCKCKSRKVAKWSFPWHKHIYFGRWTGNETRNGSMSILQLQFTVDSSSSTHREREIEREWEGDRESARHTYLLTYLCFGSNLCNIFNAFTRTKSEREGEANTHRER